ncbi:hypothetical protein [Rhizobium ruizarguesonis]|uniref:hypothetical protein n=1 Tax=Rhizobium ruizarguesonis TaxID=2081791 RepID=UPI00036F070B|nr:hypothetical protein [Rhizobium ruizarguesonis]
MFRLTMNVCPWPQSSHSPRAIAPGNISNGIPADGQITGDATIAAIFGKRRHDLLRAPV